MRIGVLGPLRVEAAGRQVPVPGRLPRRLLATLVACAGQSCSLDTLIDQVWGEDAPPSAVKTLQAYVARLRGLIGVDTIATTANGYRLMVPAHSIDTVAFTDLARRARLALQAGDPAEATRLLAEAFGWWRGEPYAEFSDMTLGVAEHRRLTEVRLAADELRVDAYLATGQELEAVAEVEALVTAHPLRERFWAQLMLALYRCGRQADALAAYQRARRLLTEEVGADPGAALQELERQILQQDPALDRADGPVARVAAGAVDGDPTQRHLGTVLVAGIAPGDDASRWDDPERVETWLRRFGVACRDAVEATGGVVTGHTESGVVAAFGVVAGQDDQACRALDAALAIRAWCRDTLGNQVAVRVGVASGSLARRGVPPQIEVIGEPARLAGALCHAAGPDQVLASQRSVGLAQQRFCFAPPAQQPFGSVGSVLLGHQPQPWARSIAGLPRVFVGREDELAALAAGYRRAVRLGRPFLVTVRGEPGIGKSTLVTRFADHVRHTDPDATIHFGRCVPYGAGTSYEALAETLRTHLGLTAVATTEQVRQQLSAAPILGLTLGLDVTGPLDPMTARSMLHRAWAELLGEACRSGPMVLVIEDVHWAPPPLLDLVDDLLAEVAGPLFVVATARPEPTEAHHATLETRRHRTMLWLDRLSDEHAAAMLRELLGEGPPDGLHPAVLARADGNPFFIEELLATLIERGVLTASAQGWLMADAATDHLPDTIRAALTVRVGRLRPDPLATLQAAAVAGPVFTTELLAGVRQPSIVDLTELLEADLIRPLPGDRDRYAFKHALVRQVTYDLLPVARRVRLHATCAQILAARGDAVEKAASLAYHYAEAADPAHVDLAWEGQPEEHSRVREGALEWLHRAAVLANRRYAGEEALQLLHRGLALDPPRDVQARYWMEIGETHGLRLDSLRARHASQQGIELSDDSEAKANAYAGMATAAFGWGAVLEPPPPAEQVVEWATRAIELGDPDSWAYGMGLQIRVLWLREDFAPVAEWLLARARRTGELGHLGQAHSAAAVVATRHRRHDVALEWHLRTVASYEADGTRNPHTTGYCYQYPLQSLLALGRFAEARQYATRFEQVSATQSPAHLAHAIAWWVQIETLAGEWERVGELEERVRRATRINSGRAGITTVRALLSCATARVMLDDPDGAAQLAKTAIGFGDDSDPRVNAPWLRLAMARHDLPEIRRLFAANYHDLPPYAMWWALDNEATRLDAMAALGETEQLAAEATLYQQNDPYLAAVADRALGTVRREPARLHAAARAFEAMGLPAQARATRALTDAPRGQT